MGLQNSPKHFDFIEFPTVPLEFATAQKILAQADYALVGPNDPYIKAAKKTALIKVFSYTPQEVFFLFRIEKVK